MVMMKRSHFGLLIASVGASMLLASAGWAGASMRCGDRVVLDGVTRAEVRARCGAPASIERQDIMELPSYLQNGRRVFFGTEFVAVPVEIWTYNFGPNTFMRRLRFVNDLLLEIDTLGYGYNEPKPE